MGDAPGIGQISSRLPVRPVPGNFSAGRRSNPNNWGGETIKKQRMFAVWRFTMVDLH
jgi:hypothetical protein